MRFAIDYKLTSKVAQHDNGKVARQHVGFPDGAHASVPTELLDLRDYGGWSDHHAPRREQIL
jgi:hypothetical protein